MNRITGAQIEQLARQASLEIAENERELYAEQLNSALEMLSPLLGSGDWAVESLPSEMPPPATWREDRVAPSLPLEKVFQNTSCRDQDYFRVPQITSPEE